MSDSTSTKTGNNGCTTLLRADEVMRRLSISRSNLYTLIAKEGFPEPLRLSKRGRAWLESEVDEWILSKADERKSSNGEGR